MKLNKKMFIYFSILAFILIILFFSTSRFIFNQSFEQYKLNTVESEDKEYIQLIEDIYEANNGNINNEDLRIIDNNIRERVAIKFYDSNGNLSWELSIKNPSNIMGMGQGRGRNENLNFEEYTIIVNDINYGTLLIGRYGNFHLSEEDITFQEDLNNGILLITLVAVIITIIISFIFSKQISKPILKIKESAEKIRDKKSNWFIQEKYNTYELKQLAQTINSLGEALETQEMLRIRLTSDVSHELRTPLNVLQNQIEALQDGILEVTEERLEEVRQEVLRMTNLVKDLEKLTDITKYNIELKKERINLNIFLQQELHNFKNLSKSKKIEVEFLDNTNKDVILEIDKNKFKQVLLNMFYNSEKYSSDKVYIRVEIEESNNNISIRIIDRGIGIAKESKDYIFERFYREEKSRNRETGGAGLGLSIVKGIVEAHKGHIYLNTENNKETEFVIKLPK